jgi:manganese/zinc/iron transport system permease protein
LLFKEFGALSFDREFLAVQGRPVFFLDVLMMALLCVCTIIGLPAVGVVLMAALLIIPAAAARFWTERLAYMVLISGGIGFFSALVGTAISALAARFPAGPLVVLTASACFVGSVLFAPRRGVIARLWRRRALSRRVEMQNVLRAMFEVGDSGGTFSSPAALEQLLRMRAWRAPALLRCLERTAARGLLRTVADGYVLTDTGLIEARKVVRAHRLWEQYLIEHADVAPDHVDRDADQIEHILPQELIHRLEERLRADGRLPQALPESPHRLGEATP